MVESYNKEKLFHFYNLVENFVVYGNGNLNEITDIFSSECEDKKCGSKFADGLKKIQCDLEKDLAFFMESDPAITSEQEVVLAYPGFKAITAYRVAHLLKQFGFDLNSRLISEHAHVITGIDIHPGAQIGVPFFIDHGTGIVIGETTIIGKKVKIYQGVTLGALSLAKGSQIKGVKRHPTIGDNVTIYAGASILGDVSIGNNVTIGGNVFLLDNVPSDTKVILPKPELIVLKKKAKKN